MFFTPFDNFPVKVVSSFGFWCRPTKIEKNEIDIVADLSVVRAKPKPKPKSRLLHVLYVL
jgi:hypothetical protein